VRLENRENVRCVYLCNTHSEIVQDVSAAAAFSSTVKAYSKSYQTYIAFKQLRITYVN